MRALSVILRVHLYWHLSKTLPYSLGLSLLHQLVMLWVRSTPVLCLFGCYFCFSYSGSRWFWVAEGSPSKCHYFHYFLWHPFCWSLNVQFRWQLTSCSSRKTFIPFLKKKNSFLMWTIFKVFIEFITRLLLFQVLFFWPWGLWDLSSLTRDRTCSPCIGRCSLNHWTASEVSLSLPFG